jgi:hypothetical protein
MPKRYTHKDKFVELEFQNLYTEFRKQTLDVVRGISGTPGVAGPPGPDGEDGQSGIQTLCKWFTGSGLLGTVPANALISGLWAIVYSWNTPHDTGTFQIEANSVTEISTVVDLTQQAPNFVLWPRQEFFDSEQEFIGSLVTVDTDINFVTNKTGQFLVCLNFIPTVAL